MQGMMAGILLSLALMTTVASSADTAPATPDRRTDWHGYDQFHFEIAGRPAYIVVPKQVAPGRPWVWRARFPNFHADADVLLLGRGIHIAYVDVAGLYGAPRAMEIADAFYRELTTRRGFALKPVLEGVSRGGLFVYNLTARHPDRIAGIYCDTPVLDFKSWPGGKGQGLGSPGSWQECLRAYGLTEEQGLTYAHNPLDHASVIARAKIPLLHIVSENDRVVPPVENTYVLKQKLADLGHPLDVISVAEGTPESNGHHFTHPEVDRVAAFMERHAKAASGWGSVTQIVAHRGASTERPENTLASTRRAIEAGATAVEVDVRRTKDGHLVLLHDATLDRTTDGQGPVSAMTLADVQKLDAGSWFNAAYQNERVATLIDVLHLSRGRIDVLLDLKESGDGYDRQVAAAIREHGEPARTIVGVRSVEQAERFRELLPGCRQIGLIATPGEIEAYAAGGVETIRLWPQWLTDETLVPRVRTAGCALHLNGTTGTIDEVRPKWIHRPESTSGDDPARLIQTLQALHAAPSP